MLCVFPTPGAVSAVFNLPFHGFLILAGIVITPCADGTLESNQFIGVFGFSHNGEYSIRLPLFLQDL
jgi:hypothetical protein